MAIEITSQDQYQRAKDRLEELRASGQTVANNGEMAELQAAVEAYGAKPGEPDVAKGKPTPDPYGHDR